LAIIGPDEGAKGDLVDLVRDLGLTDVVTFVDTLEGEEKLQAYVDSDVVVYAAQYESFGMVAVEATMCGVPVISTRDTGCGQLLEHLGADFLVEFGKVPQMAEAIDYVLTHPAEVLPKVRAAREKLMREFSWAHIASRYEDVYRSVLHQSGMRKTALVSTQARVSEKP